MQVCKDQGRGPVNKVPTRRLLPSCPVSKLQANLNSLSQDGVEAHPGLVHSLGKGNFAGWVIVQDCNFIFLRSGAHPVHQPPECVAGEATLDAQWQFRHRRSPPCFAAQPAGCTGVPTLPAAGLPPVGEDRPAPLVATLVRLLQVKYRLNVRTSGTTSISPRSEGILGRRRGRQLQEGSLMGFSDLLT